jgi:hypothetical protein
MILYELAIAAENKEELMKAIDRVYYLSKLGIAKGKQESNNAVPGYSYDFKVTEEER